MESTSSAPIYGVSAQYFNEDPHPVTYDAYTQTYTWSGGSYTFNPSLSTHANVNLRCIRVLIFENVTHNGAQYTLNSPIVLSPSGSYGSAVPSAEPYVNDCWDYVDNNLLNRVSGSGPFLKILGTYGFVVDAQRLYQKLIVEGGVSIPAGKEHDIALECRFFVLRKHEAGTFTVLSDANVSIIAKAFWSRP